MLTFSDLNVSVFSKFSHSVMLTFACFVSDFSECSDLFLTCGKSEIRVWSTTTNQEVVRITVPNMTCNAIAIMRCGTCIISGKQPMAKCAVIIFMYGVRFVSVESRPLRGSEAGVSFILI